VQDVQRRLAIERREVEGLPAAFFCRTDIGPCLDEHPNQFERNHAARHGHVVQRQVAARIRIGNRRRVSLQEVPGLLEPLGPLRVIVLAETSAGAPVQRK
jgi:hypothetical protein